MWLPNAEQAYIPPEKLTDYLLSPTHAVGGPKARFFLAIGFGPGSSAVLEQELLKLARSAQVAQEIPSPHGTKYIVEGPIDTPSGSQVGIRTIWIIEPGIDRPRFVTAYPLK